MSRGALAWGAGLAWAAALVLVVGCEPGGIALKDGRSPEDTARDTAADTDTETIPDTDDTDTDVPDTDEPDVDYDEPEPDVRVSCAGGGDFTTLAEAIAASPSGTRIGLEPCTYGEAVDFRGKTLDIYGLGERDEVVIAAPPGAPAVVAQRGEGPGTRLAHLTISGGGGTYGAALSLYTALLTLQDVTITDVGRTSALIYGEGIGLTLSDVHIEGNSFARGGYLFYVDNGWLTAQWLTAACDGAQYGVVQHLSMLLLDSRVHCPTADVAVYVSGGELHARRSDVVGGDYGIYGEDNNDTRNERLWLFNTSVVADDTAVSALYMNVRARNDVFWGGRIGLSLSYGYADSYLYSSYFHGSRCPVQGDGYAYANGWNALGDEPCRLAMADALVVDDPGFLGAPDDFHLAAGSPLLDAGDPDPDRNDDDDTQNDIGRYGGPEADGPR